MFDLFKRMAVSTRPINCIRIIIPVNTVDVSPENKNESLNLYVLPAKNGAK